MTDNPRELQQGISTRILRLHLSPALALATAIRIKTILIDGIDLS
jgi:hypothetical protein